MSHCFVAVLLLRDDGDGDGVMFTEIKRHCDGTMPMSYVINASIFISNVWSDDGRIEKKQQQQQH